MSRVIIIDVTKTWTHTLQSTVEALQDYLQRQAMDTSAIWVVSEAQKTLVRPRATDQVRVIGAGNDYSAILQAPSAVAEVVTEQTADAKVTRVDATWHTGEPQYADFHYHG